MFQQHYKFLSLILIIISILILTKPISAEDNLPVRNMVINSSTGMALADYLGWIYVTNKETNNWEKLIPGRNPQWTKDGNFYYFLNVGYDGNRSELWMANSDGGARARMSRSDYFIGLHSPIVSKDGTKIVYHNSLSNAEGGFEIIVLIKLRGLDEEAPPKTIFKKPPYTSIKLIGWIDNKKIKAKVGGKEIEISTD